MNGVRRFRLALAGLMIAVASVAALQGDWANAGLAMLSWATTTLAAVAVRDGNNLLITNERPWRDVQAWATPALDLVLVLMLALAAWGVFLHWLPD